MTKVSRNAFHVVYILKNWGGGGLQRTWTFKSSRMLYPVDQ